MRLILTSVAAAALCAGAAVPALAHGGAYRGPGGEVPADSREPSDPPPPPEPGGPGTPGGDNTGGPGTPGGDVGGGPTTGGDGGAPPSSGGGGSPPPPPPGGGAGPTTGTGPKKGGGPKGPGYEDWTFWWNYNKDSLLNLRKLIKERSRQTGTGTGVHGFGRGAAQSSQVVSATSGVIANKVVPALKELLNTSPKDINSDIQSASAIALAKIQDPEVATKLQEIASNPKDQNYDKIVVESAALAFGMLQEKARTPEIREFLISIATDNTREGKNWFVRPFAAISLGLIGEQGDKDRTIAQAFKNMLGTKENGKDIKPAAILALGLLGNDRDVKPLLEMAKTGRALEGTKEELTDTEVAHIVSSLGRIGRAGTDEPGQETAVVDLMTTILGDKKNDQPINSVRSAAIAMGQIGAKCGDVKIQKKILGTLKSVIADADDNQTKHFALISVGRIGAAGEVDAAVRGDCLDLLRHHLDKGKNLTPTFAAMGIGVIGQSMGRGTADDEKIRKPLREKFADTKESRSRGAYAVALGLVADANAVEMLREVVKDKGADPKLRGYAALGLGMINPADRAVANEIKTVLVNEDNRELRVQTAIAAGLLADAGVIEEMVKILKDRTQSQYVLGSIALALGQVGAESAIEPLIEIAKDSKGYPDLTRALATVALGQIGDRAEVPVLSKVSTDINYRDQPSYEVELLTIL